jgi:acyl-CoA reductase-like NAD-dependent aldehyde dehydrogenase
MQTRQWLTTNHHYLVTATDMPFGGYKSSGSGREGEPLYSLDNFLETKTVLIKMG